MFKKLFITAAAAAALSVPLAAVASADSGGDPNGKGLGQGGIPKVVGQVADSFGVNPNPGQPMTPGALFNEAKNTYPGNNTPEHYGNGLDAALGTDIYNPTPPGLGVKSGTPGCANGNGVSGAGIGQTGNACVG